MALYDVQCLLTCYGCWYGDQNTLSPGNVAEGSDGVGEDDDGGEPVKSSQSQIHVTAFRGTEGSEPKNQFKYATQCLYLQGGARFSPNTSHVIQKWTVNATLTMSHGQPGTLLEISYFRDEISSCQYKEYRYVNAI
jgi:hypothetical protein